MPKYPGDDARVMIKKGCVFVSEHGADYNKPYFFLLLLSLISLNILGHLRINYANETPLTGTIFRPVHKFPFCH